MSQKNGLNNIANNNNVNNSNNSSSSSSQQQPPTGYTKQTSLETARKMVTFKETNLDDVLSTSTSNMNLNTAAMTLKSILHDHSRSPTQQLQHHSPQQQAKWLLEQTESNYRSRDNRRNSTIIDTKQMAAFKRRVSLGSGSTGIGLISPAQSDRQHAFRQSTFESTINDNDCILTVFISSAKLKN